MDYSRSYSPVPPPCPSPQLMPQPLPTPPVYARRPSLTPSSSSRERIPPPKLRMKPSAAASTESLVFSLKDAIVAGSPSRRRFSEHANFRDPSSSQDTLDRRPRTTEVYRPTVLGPSPTSPSYKRKHRQSDSSTQASDNSFSPSSPPSRSLARKRTRSPSGAPLTPRSDTPPPVPPLPPLPSKREGRSTSMFSKKTPAIRIPELGLGLDEKLRSPLSPLLSGVQFRRRENHSKGPEPEASSFLHISPSKKQAKRQAELGRSSLGEREPLSANMVRSTHSLPDMKTAKRRSSPSFTSRILRLGTQHLVH
ncbi:hypothetical protein A7U60_g3935 [Sanghuangporus baumii]|uniref:Uncharacterized protein n=1 Tax=Sanghuangporus baumii TaxID=108892 RepID=A0A9Q5HZD8_SANBA|nr:hypothetical protein A7U60_g3935 [Sanghuangporus baumii]